MSGAEPVPPGAAVPPGPPGGPRFCASCGFELGPASNYCPACGSPVRRHLAVPGAPASAGTGERSAGATARRAGSAPAPVRAGRWARLPVLAKLAVLVASLVVVGSVVQGLLPGPPTSCVYSCGPSTGPLLADAHSYVSPLGFSVGYPGDMSEVASSFGSNVTFETSDQASALMVYAGRGSEPLGGLVVATARHVSGLLGSFRPIGPVPGAEIGFVPGEGEFYSADLPGTSDQKTVPLRVVVIAAESGGTWASVLGITPYAPAAGKSTGFQAGSEFDDVLARWRWPAG